MFLKNVIGGIKMKKLKIKLICLALIMVTVISTLTVTAINPVKIKAAKKAYGTSLKLNNDIKLNKTKTFKKKSFVKGCDFFAKKKNIRVNYTIKCSRKKEGKNYKATYRVNYKFPDNSKLVSNILSDYDKFNFNFVHPSPFYAVFDYQTGKTLEEKNKLGVNVKGSKWKWKYYPKQYYNPSGDRVDQDWIRNYKSISYSFTVTYPKNCKDVVVGIGFCPNDWEVDDPYCSSYGSSYWKGDEPYGKTCYYKKCKNTVSYMRLNK